MSDTVVNPLTYVNRISYSLYSSFIISHLRDDYLFPRKTLDILLLTMLIRNVTGTRYILFFEPQFSCLYHRDGSALFSHVIVRTEKYRAPCLVPGTKLVLSYCVGSFFFLILLMHRLLEGIWEFLKCVYIMTCYKVTFCLLSLWEMIHEVLTWGRGMGALCILKFKFDCFLCYLKGYHTLLAGAAVQTTGLLLSLTTLLLFPREMVRISGEVSQRKKRCI